MCMGDLPACMSVYHMPCVYRGQKKVSDPLGLELQTVVHCYVGSWNRTLASA